VNDDDFIVAVMNWLQALDHDFFVKGFNALVACWDKCHNRGGDYVENNVKMSECVQTVVSLW
jgi:hypothetical protein